MLLLLALIASSVNAAPAANFSGKWQLPGAGERPAAVLLLNQVGNEVTGSLTPPRGVSTGSPDNTDVLGGKVAGDAISFYLWTGFDQSVKVRYQGTLAGDTLVLTVSADGANPVKITATRAK